MKPKYKVGDLVELPYFRGKQPLGLVTRVRRYPGGGRVAGYVLLMSGGNEYEMDADSWDETESSLVQEM